MKQLQPQLERIQKIYQNSILLKSGLWYTAGRFVLRSMSFVSVLIFTRLLTTEEYGTVAIFFAWATLFSFLLTLNLNSAVTRGFFDYDGKEFESFASSVLSLSIISFVVGLIILMLIPESLSEQWFSVNKTILMLAAFTSFFVMIFTFTKRIWQAKDQFQKYVSLELSTEIITISFGVLLVLLPIWHNVAGGAAMGRMLTYSAVYTIGGLWLVWKQLRNHPLHFKREYWRYALFFSIPVLPHVLANLVLTQFDRIMINAFVGRSEAGIYSFVYQLGAVTSIIWQAINTAWQPWFFRRMNNNDATTIHLRAKQYILLFTAMTIGLIIVLPPLAKFIAPPDYQSAVNIIPIVLGGGFFQMLFSFAMGIEMYHKATAYVSVGTVIAGIVNIILNFIFIPQYGMIAAAWTTLVSYILLFAIHTFFVQYRLRVRNLFPLRLMLACGAGIVLLIILVSHFQ